MNKEEKLEAIKNRIDNIEDAWFPEGKEFTEEESRCYTIFSLIKDLIEIIEQEERK